MRPNTRVTIHVLSKDGVVPPPERICLSEKKKGPGLKDYKLNGSSLVWGCTESWSHCQLHYALFNRKQIHVYSSPRQLAFYSCFSIRAE